MSAKRSTSAWTIRPGSRDDLAFLCAALYEASQWRAGVERVPFESVLDDPHVARYVDGWGRAGDAAVIAEDSTHRPIGAAWFRLFIADEPGYGFVDSLTPELSIAVLPTHRGQGIGAALLDALLAEARSRGFRALSLSVEKDNPASRLYERFGFVRVGVNGGSRTMRVELTG